MSLYYELQRIISGIGKNPTRNLVEAAAHHLRKSKEAGSNAQTIEFTKSEEAAQLATWITKNNLWFNAVDESRYLARGAEQRVYLESDGRHVIKLNDSVFYEYWLDYFYSLLAHNYFFPKTAYELIGFHNENDVLHAVVRQSFIEITESTDPLLVRKFLYANGFRLKKNNDYFLQQGGVILEDLHDENVLTNSGVLFFIDTAIYLTPAFFGK